MTPPVSSPAIKIVKSVREQVSPEEWQTRVDLAACYRLTAMYGYDRDDRQPHLLPRSRHRTITS